MNLKETEFKNILYSKKTNKFQWMKHSISLIVMDLMIL